MPEPVNTDRGQLEAFVRRVFAQPLQGYISLCVFGSEGDTKENKKKTRALFSRDILIGRDVPLTTLLDVAVAASELARQHPNTAVFCPPPCLFAKADAGRSESNLLATRVLVAELDKRPEEGERRLREYVGQPSLVVYSGGYYVPEGESKQAKRHVYYILKDWVSDRVQLIELKRMNGLLGQIAGEYDRSAITPVHPLRWPGSVNTKGEHTLARIQVGDGPTWDLSDLRTRLDAAALSLQIEVTRERKTLTVGSSTIEVDEGRIADATESILSGAALHHPINTLAMTLLQRALQRDEAAELIKVLMHHSHARDTRPDDWQDRLEDVDRAIDSAFGKVSFGEADAELAAAIAEAAAVAVVEPVPEAPWAPVEGRIRLYRVTGRDFLTPRQPRPWLVRDLILRGAVTTCAAAPGTGKTIWSLQLAAALAAGRLGEIIGDYVQVGRGLKTLVINNEEPTEEMLRRLAATQLHYNLEPGELDGRINLWGNENPRFVAAQKKGKFELIEQGTAAFALSDMIRQLGIDLTVVDPLVSTHDGLDENSNTDMERLMSVYRGIATATNTAIMLVMHTRKATSNSAKDHAAGSIDAARGAGSIGGAARSMITLTQPGTKTLEAYGLEKEQAEEAALHLVRFDGAKANYARRRRPSWYRFQTVNLMNDTADGYEGDEVGVLVPILAREIRERWGEPAFPDDMPSVPSPASPATDPPTGATVHLLRRNGAGGSS